MPHPRVSIRADVKTALAGLAGIAADEVTTIYRKDIDIEQLPEIMVLTPREQVARVAVDQVDRTIDVMVIIRRKGGDDLDDNLDNESDDIEAAVLPVLAGHGDDEELVEVTTQFDVTGSVRVGQLEMRFRLVRYTSEAEQF